MKTKSLAVVIGIGFAIIWVITTLLPDFTLLFNI